MKNLFFLIVFLAALLAAGHPAGAGVFKYHANLSGNNEVPANTSQGAGVAEVEYDDALHSLRMQVVFSGLLGNVTAAHIHSPASPTANAGVATRVPTLPGFPSGVTSGNYAQTLDLTLASAYNPTFIVANGGTINGAEAALTASLAAGTAYFNVHTTLFPGGEIRGQFTPVAIIYLPLILRK